MEFSNNTISKAIIECLTNKTLYNLVKNNYVGFKKFSDAHGDLDVFSGVISYIDRFEYNDFNSIDLNAELRSKGIAEGTLTELFNSVDYLRTINSDKNISPKTVSLLKDLFYAGHYESVKGKSNEEIFEYCKGIDWVSNVIDPRFVIETIDSSFDVDQVVSLLSPKNSIKSSMRFINESSPTGGYLPNELVTVSAAPGTGKTQFSFTESMNFIKQKKRTLYIAIGDMVNYFITIRLMCMHFKITPNEAYLNLEKYLTEFRKVEEVKKYFSFVCLDSGTVTAKDVFQFLSVMANEYDVWIVDYDGNFARESDNMYREGGDSYDYAINVCRQFNKLGFILSQPKIAYWTAEALGKECLAESSRKQQITDTIVTFGIHQGTKNRCGYAQVVKGRNRDLAFRVPWAAADSGQLIEIDNDMYGEILESDEKLSLVVNDAGTLDSPDEYFEQLNEDNTES